MKNQDNNPNALLHKRHGKDKVLILKSIQQKVIKGTGLSIKELHNKYSQEKLFYTALKHVTTTKKAVCFALNLDIDASCRYKRNLELKGLLKQSLDEVICPYSKHMAHQLSTNPEEFERLTDSKENQLTLF